MRAARNRSGRGLSAAVPVRARRTASASESVGTCIPERLGTLGAEAASPRACARPSTVARSSAESGPMPRSQNARRTASNARRRRPRPSMTSGWGRFHSAMASHRCACRSHASCTQRRPAATRFLPVLLPGLQIARHVGHGDQVGDRIEPGEVLLAPGEQLPRFVVTLEPRQAAGARQQDAMRPSRLADLRGRALPRARTAHSRPDSRHRPSRASRATVALTRSASASTSAAPAAAASASASSRLRSDAVVALIAFPVDARQRDQRRRPAHRFVPASAARVARSRAPARVSPAVRVSCASRFRPACRLGSSFAQLRHRLLQQPQFIGQRAMRFPMRPQGHAEVERVRRTRHLPPP